MRDGAESVNPLILKAKDTIVTFHDRSYLIILGAFARNRQSANLLSFKLVDNGLDTCFRLFYMPVERREAFVPSRLQEMESRRFRGPIQFGVRRRSDPNWVRTNGPSFE